MHNHDSQVIGHGCICQFKASAIDQERMAGFALGGNELVHDAAFGAHKIAFRNLRDLREAAVVNLDMGQGEHRFADSDLKRGR